MSHLDVPNLKVVHSGSSDEIQMSLIESMTFKWRDILILSRPSIQVYMYKGASLLQCAGRDKKANMHAKVYFLYHILEIFVCLIFF